jgi:hypothetical protein
MISNLDNGIVAKSFGKTFSQIWKRKKTLQIEEYITIKELIKSAACDLGRL